MTNGNGRKYLKPGTTLKLKGEFQVKRDGYTDSATGKKVEFLQLVPVNGGEFLSFGVSKNTPGFVYGEVRDGAEKIETPKTYTLG